MSALVKNKAAAENYLKICISIAHFFLVDLYLSVLKNYLYMLFVKEYELSISIICGICNRKKT